MEMDRFWRNMHQCGPVAFGILLVAMLLICSLAPIVQAEEANSATSSEASTTCKGLKPYNNLDELLYQFYINLESDCLFTMPVEELEKVWETQILSEARLGPKQERYHLNQLRNGYVFYRKPYISNKDAFYIEIEPDRRPDMRFAIKITKEYAARYSSLFPGKLPELLPKPVTAFNPQLMGAAPRSHEELMESTRRASAFQYTWYSSDKTRKITFTANYGVSLILIMRHSLSED